MINNALERQDKGISQRIADALAERLPRRATVIRPEANGVWVKFGNDEIESWFVSTVAGVPAGTRGWVFALGGKKGLFIATGMTTDWDEFDSRYYTQAQVDAMLPIPFIHGGNSRISTTSTSTPAWVTAGTQVLPAGTFRAVGIATMPVTRNTSDGGIAPYVRIGGVEVQGGVPNMGAASWGPVEANEFFTTGVPFDIAVTSNGTTPIAFDFGLRGVTTAGTTYGHRMAMTGTLTRIG